MNYFIYYCINFFYNKEGLFIYKQAFLSPSYFNVTDTSAKEFNLNGTGYPNDNNNVTNGNGVRASFLLRLVNTNALRVNGYGC